MAFTKEQLDAINLDGENIIVSAGAGSGKTMVLTTRVIRKLESGISINKLLILTFTKLAANEMKSRIRREIKKRKELSKELKKIDNSYITTFDSFSLSLVQKYHYLLNVKKNVDIIEGNLLNIRIKEYLDTILEEEYKKKNNDFIKLINDFCLKDDEIIRNAILTIYSKLNLKYDKKEYLNNYFNNFYSTAAISKNISQYEEYLKNIIKEINIDLTKVSCEIDIDYYQKLSKLIIPVINSSSYDEIRNNIYHIERLPNLPKNSSELAKMYKENINESIKHLKELTKFLDTNALLNSIKSTKPYIEVFIHIMEKLDEKINNYKFENDLYDFSDICKMAIKLVKENKKIREEIKNSFNEIMIDEYQDTSDLQEEFINLISNNNVYVVGDVKQSIYRFRNANPNLFQKKYNLYSKNIEGKKIDLVKNFRSRKEVLDGINLIFNLIMNDIVGGANYRDTHQMIPGNDLYLKNSKEDCDMAIYRYDYDREFGFTKEEIEAFIISNDIKKKVNEHFQVFDKDKQKLRDVTYDDFAILIDRSTSFSVFKKIFLYQKIPLSIYQDEKLTDSSLFMIIRNIFRLINLTNKDDYQEIEYTFLSIGRSFLCNYQDEYLFDVITRKEYLKTNLFHKIEKLRVNLSTKSISTLLDEIVLEFDVYNKLRSIPNLYNNYVKLDYLYKLAITLNKMGYTILDFDNYLDTIIKEGMDITFSLNKEDGESVKIMTIHASKGLEYPICYYPGLYKEFNSRDIKNNIIFSDLLGVITPFNDEGITDTFYRELMKREFYQDEVSEKIRLFYVALTRAREKMILVIPNSSDNSLLVDEEIISDNKKLRYRSFLDIILSISTKLKDYIKDIDINDINITKNYNLIDHHSIFDNVHKIDEKIKIVNYPKYQSVNLSNNHFSKNNTKLFTKEEIEKMEFGKIIHYYLETIDLKNPYPLDIESPYKEKIIAFLKCDLLKNIQEAKIYQEYEFIEDDEKTIKHGIIDLILEYDNHFDIIDYKLQNIKNDAYLKQLNGYRNYISKLTNKDINIYLYSIMDESYQKL